MSKLQTGWAHAPIGQIADVIAGQAPPGDTYNSSGSGLPLYQGKTDFGDLYLKPPRVWTTAAAKVAEAGDVLLSVRAPVGPTNLATTRCAIGRGLAAVRGKGGVSQKYMLYGLRATEQALADRATGTTFAAITGSVVRDHEIPVAPVGEQERIVAAIEEQFSRLDAGVAALESARQKLARMRAAVLQSMASNALDLCGGSPSRVGSLLDSPLANGRSVPDGPPGGFPVLRLTAVRQGLIDVTCVKTGAWTASEALPFKVSLGDFLVIRGNGSKRLVGRGGLVSVDANVAYPDTLIRMRLDPSAVLPDYLAIIWDAHFVRQQIETSARTTAGIYKINQRDLEGVVLPAPPLEDQRALVAQTQDTLSTIHASEAALGLQQHRANVLRSSILAAAFSGRLAPQDPHDEAASVLLSRIAAERGASNGRMRTTARTLRTPRQKARA